MKLLHILSFLLVLLGGLNWTLIGVMDVNLFTILVGDGVITLLLYVLVTLSTLHVLIPRMIEYFHTN